jgi:hypothetical protein
VVYKDEKVTVTAFQVAHGEWAQAFGYRFDTIGWSIVISGDTTPGQEVVAYCQPCDVLIQEVYPPSSTVPNIPDWVACRAKYHTSTDQLADIAESVPCTQGTHSLSISDPYRDACNLFDVCGKWSVWRAVYTFESLL